MKLNSYFNNRLIFYIPAIFICVCLMILSVYIDNLHKRSTNQELRTSIFSQLSIIRAQLEGNINSNAQLVKGLVAAISTEPNLTQQRFASLTKPLLKQHSQLRNIAAAPDLVIRYMYPIQGNKSAIGLNYKEHPQQYKAVKNAVDLKKLVIAGPVNLVQGGQGFIARIPVFIDYIEEGKEKSKFWGLISAVIDSERLYIESGLKDKNLQIEISIRGKDSLGNKGDVFYGDKSVFADNPVYANTILPHGSWQMAAIPKGGWLSYSSNSLMFRGGLFLISIFILVPLFILGRFLEKKRQSEVLLTGLFELSPVGIALNDYETGEFVVVNDSLLKPSGYNRKEFLNLSYWDLTPREYEEQEKLQIESMEKTNRYGPYEKEYIRKDGNRYPVLLSGMVIHDIRGKKMIWSIIEDISDRKRNEKLKSEFVSTVSHELRTPLTAIAGALSLITGGVLGDITEKQNNMLKVAQKNASRLTLIINDLLDFEKLSSDNMKFNMDVYDLFNQIDEAIENNQTYANQYNVKLKLLSDKGNINVNIDAQRLQQVFANLISNAIKFSNTNGIVELNVVTNQDIVRIEIKDYGRGIPKEFHDQIFQKFSQADASDSRLGSGTGLGLAISRELILHMDGTINFKSIEGKGTSFFIELPVIKN